MSIKPKPCADGSRNCMNLLEAIAVHWDYDTRNPNRHEVAFELARAVLIDGEYALNRTPTKLFRNEADFIASKLFFMLRVHCFELRSEVLPKNIQLICEIYELHWPNGEFAAQAFDAVDLVRSNRESGGEFAEQCKSVSINGLRYRFIYEPSLYKKFRENNV